MHYYASYDPVHFKAKDGKRYVVKFTPTYNSRRQVTVYEGDTPIAYLPDFKGGMDSQNIRHILGKAILDRLDIEELGQDKTKTA